MTAAATNVPEPVVVRQLESPWMTVDETCTYTRRSKSYVLAAIRKCKRTKGRSGLKAAQEAPNLAYRVHVDDALRWMHGLPPIKGIRRFASSTPATPTWSCHDCGKPVPTECAGNCGKGTTSERTDSK